MEVEPVFAGVGESAVGKTPDRNWLELASEASLNALEDAGLDVADVDGLAMAGASDYMPTMLLGEYLGIADPTFLDATEIGGSSFLGHVETAARAMADGRAEVVLIAYGSTGRTGGGESPRGGHEIHGPVEQFWRTSGLFMTAGAYALAARRHMFEYGTTEEQLAEIAVSTREWAAMNPDAYKREPISVADVLNSPPIADPFNLLDCCLVSDGGGVVVLVAPDRAGELTDIPVRATGAATSQTHRQDMSQMPELTKTSAATTGPAAFDEAGIEPADVDVAELYDSFTYTVLTTLEDLGFCPQGEGGSFVEGGTLGPGGALPTNTQGGGLSYCHPGHFGVFVLIEAVRQLRWAYAGDRQVEDASVAVAHGTGAVLSSGSTVVLERGV